MNRDTLPTGAGVALAFAELLGAARRAVRPGMPIAEAAPAVRDQLARIWRYTPPEAARDALATAAELAIQGGADGAALDLADLGPMQAARDMLDLTAEWIADGRPAAQGAGFTPPVAYASSTAFDRDDDQATLDSLAALLAVAYSVQP